MLESLKSLVRRVQHSRVAPAPTIWTNQQTQLARYSIGDWTYGIPTVRDWGQGATLTIGKYCSIAERVTILLGGEHRTDWITTFPFLELLKPPPEARPISASRGDVRIGNDVWIGFDAMILSGVTIGSGAVIAARSVVTKPVQPYSIVAGVPARHIRFRLPEHMIPDMLRIAWWNWPDDQVIKAAPILLSERIEEFIRLYKRPQTFNTA
jgi:virginiamycin A acetyltransferase